MIPELVPVLDTGEVQQRNYEREEHAMITMTVLDKDSEGRLSVGLKDILLTLNDLLLDAKWRVSCDEALGTGAQALYDAQASRSVLSTEELLDIAGSEQIVDGVFRGYTASGVAADTAHPWIIIAAIDSTSWDISSDDARVSDRIRASFLQVHEVGDVGYGGDYIEE